MAQDFNQYFGRDAFGTIGDGKSIGTADFDGIVFAAVKGLESKTRKLKIDQDQNKAEILKQINRDEADFNALSFILTDIENIKQTLELKVNEKEVFKK